MRPQPQPFRGTRRGRLLFVRLIHRPSLFFTSHFILGHARQRQYLHVEINIEPLMRSLPNFFCESAGDTKKSNFHLGIT